MVISELVALLGYRVDNTGARQFDAQMDGLKRRADAVSAGISAGIASAVTSAGIQLAQSMAVWVGGALKAVPLAGDAMTAAVGKIQGSIEESAISGGEAVAIYEKLYEIGTRTGISANESAQSFARIQLAMQELQRPVSDTLELLEGVQSAGIAAGASTEDVNEAIRQLGQSLGKGKLNGDELVSLMERMPAMMHAVRKEMGMTTAQFFKASEDGKLTPELLVPALLKAGEKAREDLAKFPITMSLGFSVMRNAALRFAAELDKQLGLSQAIAKVFLWIARTLDSWRSGLTVVGDIVRELGGLEGIARLVGAALIALVAPSFIGALGAISGGFMGIAAAVMRTLLPLAGFVAWALIIEDFIGWIQGKDSLFGERFGEFGPILDQIKAKFAEFREAFPALDTDIKDFAGTTIREFMGLYEAIKPLISVIVEAWKAFVEDVRNAPWAQIIAVAKAAWDAFVADFKAMPGAVHDAWAGLRDFFTNLFNSISNSITGFLDAATDRISRFGAWLGSFIPGMGGIKEMAARSGWNPGSGDGTSAGGFPGMSDFFRNSVSPDVSGRMAGGPSNTNVQAPVDADINVYITAPAGDAMSIGSAARSGVMSAMGESATRLGDSLARGLGVTMPRIEAPATP